MEVRPSQVTSTQVTPVLTAIQENAIVANGGPKHLMAVQNPSSPHVVRKDLVDTTVMAPAARFPMSNGTVAHNDLRPHSPIQNHVTPPTVLREAKTFGEGPHSVVTVAVTCPESYSSTQDEVESDTEMEIKEEPLSDADMEIKSLDLTGGVKRENEKDSCSQHARPMSCEDDGSSGDIKCCSPYEEQMRMDVEEPISPMCTTLAALQVPLEEQNRILFCSKIAAPADSPLPTRSDSGCEVHQGPYTPSQSPLVQRIHPHAHSPTHLYSPSQSPCQSRHLSGFSSPYSHTPSTGLSRNNSDASQYGGSYTSYSSAPSPISPTHYSPSQSPIQQHHVNSVITMAPHQSPNLGRSGSHYSGGHDSYMSALDLRDSHSYDVSDSSKKHRKRDCLI